jgi:hypothetical protein
VSPLAVAIGVKATSGEAIRLERKGHELHFSGAATVRLDVDILDCFVSNPAKAAAAVERFIAPLDMSERRSAPCFRTDNLCSVQGQKTPSETPSNCVAIQLAVDAKHMGFNES